MDKIGTIAARSGLSVRTLRYWEQIGILTSVRGENGYRYYDTKSVRRIERIAILKRWELPLADIERILKQDDKTEMIVTLKAHGQNIRARGRKLQAIAEELNKVVALLSNVSAEDDVYPLLDTLAPVPYKILSSQGEHAMQTQEPLRIVKLPRLTVAATIHEGEGCEDACWNDILPLIQAHGLDQQPEFRLIGHGHYGRNGQYAYEQWVTIPKDLVLPEGFAKKTYQGGLHASLPCSLADIGERWKELYNRLENDPVYAHNTDDERGDLCLEECPDYEGFLAPGVPLTARRLDLLVAVVKR